MDYNMYISKLREMSTFVNPRQVYLNDNFSKTSLYKSLNEQARKKCEWAVLEKLIYKYIRHYGKSNDLKYKGSCNAKIYAMDTRNANDVNVASKYNYHNRKKTEIANEYYSITSHSIIDMIKGIEF